MLNIDEKSQIQALDRTQPRLPIKKAALHLVLDNYGTHKHPKVTAWLEAIRAS